MAPSSPDLALVARLRAAGCVWAEDEATLIEADGRPVEDLVTRRVAGEPLEQVLGWAEFRGRRYAVAPGVFVPRHRSGMLVEQAAARLRSGDVLVDLCCGVGALAGAIGDLVRGLEVHAVDVDPAAVACARANLTGASVAVGDLVDPLPADLRGRVAVVVANAPYVPSGAVASLPREARDHERLAALDGGTDGLDVHRRIAASAGEWLRPGGALLVEVSPGQAPVLAAAYAGHGLVPTTTVADDTAVVCGVLSEDAARG